VTCSGANGAGTVLEIAYTPDGYASTPITLVSFDDTDGSGLNGSLIIDAHGNLFGTTAGGANGYGTVFEIAKTTTGYASTPIVLVSFDHTNGRQPPCRPDRRRPQQSVWHDSLRWCVRPRHGVRDRQNRDWLCQHPDNPGQLQQHHQWWPTNRRLDR
jgi:uncharacterized repeat protein (TIGR03803 family)